MESEFVKLLDAPEYIPAGRVSDTSVPGSFDVNLEGNSSEEKLQPVKIPFKPEAGDVQQMPEGTDLVQSESFTVVSKESIGDVTVVVANKNFNQAASAVEESRFVTKIPKKKAASARQLESQSKVSSRPTTSHESIKREMSQSSMTSGTSRAGATTAKLPHQLGSLPSYMTKMKIERKPTSAGSTFNKSTLFSVSTVHPTVSAAPSSADPQTGDTIEDVKKKYLAVMAKANEHRSKLSDMCKQNEILKKKLEDSEKLNAEKEAKLADSQRKLHSIEMQKRAQTRQAKNTDDSIEKVKKLEEENATLAAQNEELTKKVAQKDGTLANIRLNSQRLEKESEKKSKEIEALLAGKKQPVEVKSGSDHDIQRVTKLEKQLKELKAQLKQRDVEIGDLKRNAFGVVDVLHKSISSASKGSQKGDAGDANQVKKLVQENYTLKSQLDDERHKNIRAENLLQLRAEYIKTLQDTDELQKMRLTASACETEKLQAKLIKARTFKAAKAEELANLHNTLQTYQMENAKLTSTNELMQKFYQEPKKNDDN